MIHPTKPREEALQLYIACKRIREKHHEGFKRLAAVTGRSVRALVDVALDQFLEADAIAIMEEAVDQASDA